MSEQASEGRRILLVEDEYFLATDLARRFKARGANVIGPVATVEGALGLIEASAQLDGAIVDLNLRGEMAYPIADALSARRVPFVFATGYDQISIPAVYAHVIRCEKPVAPDTIFGALFG